MGHRANYILIKNNSRFYYTSRWGAYGIENLLFAPSAEAIEKEICRQDPANENELYDDVWAEGGILLDLDRATLLLYSDIGIRSNTLRHLLIPRFEHHTDLKLLWPAYNKYETMMYYPGLPPEKTVTTSSKLVSALKDDRPFTDFFGDFGACCISIVFDDTQIEHYLLVVNHYDVLSFGPEVITILRTSEKALPKNRWPREIDTREGILINIPAKTIYLWGEEISMDHRMQSALKFFQRQWKQWTFIFTGFGLPIHYALLDIPPEPYRLTTTNIIAYLDMLGIQKFEGNLLKVQTQETRWLENHK